MSQLIKWKYRSRVNTHEGTIKGDTEPLLFICGGLCVTDIRESRKSSTFISPKSYKVIGLPIEARKQLAEDLVTGNNFEKHEQNRLDWLKENQRTTDLINKADKFLKKLNTKKS